MKTAAGGAKFASSSGIPRCDDVASSRAYRVLTDVFNFVNLDGFRFAHFFLRLGYFFVHLHKRFKRKSLCY